MDLQFINPFVSSAISVIKEVVGLVAIKKQIYVAKGKESLGGVSIFFDIFGDIEGQIIFDLPAGISTALAKAMIGLNLKEIAVDNENKDMFKSAVTELGNMISGSAITRLEEYNYDCDIRAPLVYVGPKTRLTHPSLRTIVIEMNTNVGEFSINLVNKKGFDLKNLSFLLVKTPSDLSLEIVHTFIPRGFYVYSSDGIEVLRKEEIDFVIVDIDSIAFSVENLLNEIHNLSKNRDVKVILYMTEVTPSLLSFMRSFKVTGCILKNGNNIQVLSNIQNILRRLGIEITERRSNIYVNIYDFDKFKINIKRSRYSNELIEGEIEELGVTGVVFRPSADDLSLFKVHDELSEIQLILKGKYVLVNGIVIDIKGDRVGIRFISIRERFVNTLSEIIYTKISKKLL